MKRRKTVKDLRVPDPHGTREDDELDEHESYGMVSIFRQQWGGDGAVLFGSKIQHGSVISLQVHRAQRSRSKYHEHYFQKKQLIEILLSPAQFTSMLTQMNTSGSACTLSRVMGETMEAPPSHDTLEELKDDLAAKYKELADRVDKLNDVVEKGLQGSVKAQDKKDIMGAVTSIHQDISMNLDYLRKCQQEKLEQAVSEAKAEVESTMVTTLINAGIEHIKVGGIEMITIPKPILSTEDES